MNRVSEKKDDGFTFVSYKSKKKKNCKEPFCSAIPESLKAFDSVINSIQDDLSCSDFMIKFKEDLQNMLQEWSLKTALTRDNYNDSLSNEGDKHLCVNSDVSDLCMNNKKDGIDIVCYGLGQFSSCMIARYQLGFLLVLKNVLHSSQVFIYDPQFSMEERDILNELRLDVLNINEEAKRKCERKTLCFMPHCDLPLYNNLLWANWSIKQLSELIIIGNSFQSYEINDAKSQLQAKAKYVYLANRFATEVKMTNNFRYTDIFNDLSIHYFKSGSLAVVESYIWTDLCEPEYSDDDIIKSY